MLRAGRWTRRLRVFFSRRVIGGRWRHKGVQLLGFPHERRRRELLAGDPNDGVAVGLGRLRRPHGGDSPAGTDLAHRPHEGDVRDAAREYGSGRPPRRQSGCIKANRHVPSFDHVPSIFQWV
jgi:hypothetical protein